MNQTSVDSMSSRHRGKNSKNWNWEYWNCNYSFSIFIVKILESLKLKAEILSALQFGFAGFGRHSFVPHPVRQQDHTKSLWARLSVGVTNCFSPQNAWPEVVQRTGRTSSVRNFYQSFQPTSKMWHFQAVLSIIARLDCGYLWISHEQTQSSIPHVIPHCFI